MAIGFDSPIHTNDQSIDRVLATGIPTLLVFLEERTTPALDEILSTLAHQHQGKLLVALVRANENPVTRQKYTINRFPAVVALRSGQPISQAEGISAQEAGQHAAFLLGHGPKPETSAAHQPSEQAHAPSGAHPGGSSSRPIPVDEASFDGEVLHAAYPVLVDFWAPWCGPCRMTDPILEKLARELAGRLIIAKVNVDENPRLSQRFGVQGIPAMMVVKNGKIVDRWVGALPEPALRSRITSHLTR